MNRPELSQLLLKNDIPVEMRMMLCKLADLGVEIGEDDSIEFLENAIANHTIVSADNGLFQSFGTELIAGRRYHISATYNSRTGLWWHHVEEIIPDYFHGESIGDIEEGDAVAINRDGRIIRIGEVEEVNDG